MTPVRFLASMPRSRVLTFLALVTPGAITLVAACADQTNEGFPEATEDAGSSTRRDGGGGGGTEEEEDSGTSTPKDSGAGKPDANCTPVAAPVEDGGGQCATIEFGPPGGPLRRHRCGRHRLQPRRRDPARHLRRRGGREGFRPRRFDPRDSRGPPERPLTRIRQLDATGNSAGPLSRRSGSYKYSDAGVTFTYECATNDGAFIDAGSDTFPYEYVEGAGECQKGVYRFGLTSLRFTHQRR